MKAPSLEGVKPREKNLEIQRVVLSWPQNAAVVSIRFQITEGERICVQCFSRAFSYLCLTRKNVCGCMLFAGAGRRRTLEAAAYNSWNSCQIPPAGWQVGSATHPVYRTVCKGFFVPQMPILSLLQSLSKQVQTGSMAVAWRPLPRLLFPAGPAHRGAYLSTGHQGAQENQWLPGVLSTQPFLLKGQEGQAVPDNPPSSNVCCLFSHYLNCPPLNPLDNQLEACQPSA